MNIVGVVQHLDLHPSIPCHFLGLNLSLQNFLVVSCVQWNNVGLPRWMLVGGGIRGQRGVSCSYREVAEGGEKVCRLLAGKRGEDDVQRIEKKSGLKKSKRLKLKPGSFPFATMMTMMRKFADELTLLKSFPPGIDETDCHPEKEIRLTKRLLYDNSSPRPPEEIVSDNSNADIESFSLSPIPNLDSDPLMEEIDLSFNPDDPMPPSIEEDDDDSERDIPILEELLDNYSLSLPNIESYDFDIPSPYRPPAKPPDGNTGILKIKMMGDVSDQKVPISNLTITRILNQDESPDLLSHLGFEAFQPSAECPMIINGKNIPVSDVHLFHFYPLDQFKYGGIRSSSMT
nr:hypothetical protein [Tanacetum cinerariifolium]